MLLRITAISSLLLASVAIADTGHYFTAGYDLAGSATFLEGFDHGDEDDKYASKYDFDGGGSAGYEFRKSEANNWGLGVGLVHHAARDLESVIYDGDTQELSGSYPSVSMTSLYANAIYRWEAFFVYFGLNVSDIDYQIPSGKGKVIGSKGGIGANLGLGLQLGERVIIEYGSRSASWDLEVEDEEGTKRNLGFGALGFASLTLKLRFF